MATNLDFVVKNGIVVNTSATILSTSTSALTVAGGVDIGGDIYIEGNTYITGNTFIQGIDLLAYDGDVYFVNGIGNDNNNGHLPYTAFATIKKALSTATNGDKIYIEAGIYYEDFPLVVPVGVSLMGAGLRAVTIYPTTATNTQTALLLSGESYVSDLTLRGIKKPGYGFAFNTGTKITIRSPYVERVTVLNQGSVTTVTDPYGFDAGDAGGGAYLDASVLDPTSLEPAMLWNEVTFIVPNATGWYMTNGARAELLNGFSYFADTAIHAVTSSTGYGGVGKTRLRLGGTKTGTFLPGEILTYKNSNGTILATGTIHSTSSDYVFLTGPAFGFETITDRPGKVVTAYGNAQQSTTFKKFGNSSAIFDGTGDYLEITSNGDFSFGTGDFCIEGWIYRTAGSAYQTIFDMRTAATDVATLIGIDNLNQLYCYLNGSIVIQGSTAISASTWVHIALARSGTSLRLFLNGNQQSTTYTDNSNYSSKPFRIGSDYSGAFGYTGYIDEVRVTKGVARYTTSTFTPPEAQLGSDNGTVLLLHMNSGNGSTAFFDDAQASQDVYSSGGATATRIDLADYHQFGAELRCIGSAAVFGTKGVIANGTGTDLKLIAFNISHIGSGKDLSDDISLVVQSNEIIQQNGGKIYYQTVDQNGDFRVGNNFLINQRTGNVTFGEATVNIGNLSSLNITDGVDSTYITPGNIEVNNLSLSSNQISTDAGNLTIDPAGSLTTINSDLQINGNTNIAGATQSTGTTTGALTVAGGVGIGGDVYAGTIYSNGLQVLTSGGGGGGYVSSIAAGTDTAVSTSTGDIVIWNTSTLQTVASRGHVTNTPIEITNLAISSSTTTGALIVTGGIATQGNIRGADGNPEENYLIYSPKVTISPTPPATATNHIGDFWIDSSIGVEYQWVLDGSNYFWIQFTRI